MPLLRGVPFRRKSPLKRGPYSTENHRLIRITALSANLDCATTPHQAIISSSQNVRMLTIVRAETARTNSKLLRDLALGQGILSSEARALQSII